MRSRQHRIIVFSITVLIILNLVSCSGKGSNKDNSISRTNDTKVSDILSFGGYDWRVLDIMDGKALVISEKVLFSFLYNTERVVATWETCLLREYLNTVFYNNTFSTIEKSRIIETSISNKPNQWYETSGGTDTFDKIFLLSLEELVSYFGDSGQLASPPNNDASAINDEYNEARKTSDESDRVAWDWWLRSPGRGIHGAAYVKYDGTIDVAGWDAAGGSGNVWFDAAGSGGVVNERGVRPVFWLSLSEAQLPQTQSRSNADEILTLRNMHGEMLLGTDDFSNVQIEFWSEPISLSGNNESFRVVGYLLRFNLCEDAWERVPEIAKANPVEQVGIYYDNEYIGQPMDYNIYYEGPIESELQAKSSQLILFVGYTGEQAGQLVSELNALLEGYTFD